MELRQEGYLSKQRYKITTSKKYEKLYKEAVEQNKSLSWGVLAGRGKNFPLLLEQTASINLKNASSGDIGTLIKYFSYRSKTIERILDNIRYERI